MKPSVKRQKRPLLPDVKGWVKLHRKLLHWEHHDDPTLLSVFIHLLLMASPEECVIGGYKVPRGGVVVSKRDLAADLNMDRGTLDRALKRLAQSGCIKYLCISPIAKPCQEACQGACQEAGQVPNQRRTLVIVINFDSYQSKKLKAEPTNEPRSVSIPEPKAEPLYIKEEYKEDITDKFKENLAVVEARDEIDFLSLFELRVAEVCDGTKEVWLDSMAKKLNLSRPQVIALMSVDFRDHCIRNAIRPWPDVRGFMIHFNRWATNRPPERKHASAQSSTKVSSGCGISRPPKK